MQRACAVVCAGPWMPRFADLTAGYSLAYRNIYRTVFEAEPDVCGGFTFRQIFVGVLVCVAVSVEVVVFCISNQQYVIFGSISLAGMYYVGLLRFSLQIVAPDHKRRVINRSVRCPVIRIILSVREPILIRQ